MRVAIIFENLGPYHQARIAAAARGLTHLAITDHDRVDVALNGVQVITGAGVGGGARSPGRPGQRHVDLLRPAGLAGREGGRRLRQSLLHELQRHEAIVHGLECRTGHKNIGTVWTHQLDDFVRDGVDNADLEPVSM